jgi:hypothetical protein
LRESENHSWLESHLAWPDSFFQWYEANWLQPWIP